MTDAFHRLTDALSAHGSAVRPQGERQAQAQCPAHEDRAPSLSITRGESRVLVKCHAGCDTDNVLEVLGLSRADLFDELRSRGNASDRREVARYPYTDAAGTVLFEKIRYDPKDFRITPPGAVAKLDGRPLYRLPEVLAAAAAGETVYVVEGEKDADALAALGYTATCNYDGAAKDDQQPKWRSEYNQQLAGAQVVIVADRDNPGRAHARAIAASLDRHDIRHQVLEARAGKDASDHLAAGHSVDQLTPVDLQQAQHHDLDEVFPVLDWHQLWQETPDEVEWVCEPLLEKGRSAVVYSPPKAGKSLVSLEIAAALSCGRPVLGNPARDPLTILYVDLENAGADIKERLQALGYGPADLGRLRYLSFPSLAALDTPTGGAQIVALVDRHQAAVVIIDTVSRVISGEENDADTFAALYRHALVPLKARGITVLRLDHSGKDLEKGQRGSSAKSADVDHVWRLTDHGNGRLAFRRDASRTGHGADRLNLERHYEPLRHLPPTIITLPARFAAIIAELDAAGLPDDAGRDRARKALTDAGVKASNQDLAEALRIRKERPADLSRTGQHHPTAADDQEACPEDTDSDSVSAGQTCPGQVPDRSGQTDGVPADDLSVPPPSLRGGQVSAPDNNAAAVLGAQCPSCKYTRGQHRHDCPRREAS